MSAKRGNTTFKPKARIIKLLGEQLITDEVIALVELVKNSYDADATEVTVTLEKAEDVEEGKIRILDNGSGMSLDTVTDAWLQPGTNFRMKQRKKGERSSLFGRPILGEKGVGRFAAQKLGSLISLATKNIDAKFETMVEVNWETFEEDALLSDIVVNWIQVEPKIFKDKATGTLIEIQNLKKQWTKPMVLRLAQKLQSLQSPFKQRADFKVTLKCDFYPKIEEDVKFIDEYLDRAVYSLVGSISSEGLLTGKYHFNNPAFKDLERKESFESKDIKDLDHFKTRGVKPTCGEMHFRFFVWDLDSKTLSETVTRQIYNNFIRPYTGLRVYRDSFRVWPYGEEGNDWLGLDQRRVNTPKKCLSNNQVVGIIDISQMQNPSLLDKTDREGLILNRAFEDFHSIVLSALSELETERRKDKIVADRLIERKKGKKLDSTIEAIDNIRDVLEHDGLSKYGDYIHEIELAYKFEVRNVHEPLITAAGLGLAYQMPAHEIQIQLKGLRSKLDEFEEDMARIGLSGRITERLSDTRKIVEILREVSEGALELSRRKKTTFSLKSAIVFAEKIKKPEMNRVKVNSDYVTKEDISINGYQNYFITSILNLIDNSIWWLQKVDKDRVVKFTIKRDQQNNPLVIVSDNGPGIEESDIPFLGEAYFTRKLHGTGLGLFIVKRSMQVNLGEFRIGFHGDDPDFLEGANIMLVFKQARGSSRSE